MLTFAGWEQRFRQGDFVIYRKQKASTSPGPRARDVMPAPRGESYAYVVEKQWRVADVHEDGSLVLVTRTGKVHVADPDDRNLRRPSWWERWRLRHRFPALPDSASGDRAAHETPHDGIP